MGTTRLSSAMLSFTSRRVGLNLQLEALQTLLLSADKLLLSTDKLPVKPKRGSTFALDNNKGATKHEDRSRLAYGI